MRYYKCLLTVFIIIIVVCANYSIAETDDKPDPQTKKKGDITTRDRQVMEILTKAQDLKNKQEYESALNNYIKFYHESLTVPGLSGDRISSALPEMRQIYDVYPQAIEKLKVLRGAIEKRIQSGEFITKDCRELLAFDKVFEQKEKTISTYDVIVTKFGKSSLQRNNFVEAIWEELYALKRYEDIEVIIGKLVKREVILISEYMIELDFPSKRFQDDPKYKYWMESIIVNDGIRFHEILQTIGWDEESTKLKKWLLNLCNDDNYSTKIRKKSKKDLAGYFSKK